MNRRDFLSTIPIMLTSAQQLLNEVNAMPPTPLMPAFFIGHGSPMNAITDNKFTQDLAKSTRNLPAPNAILVVSAHWLTRGTFVSTNKFPKTIYDFGGFPKALSEVKYEPLGSPEYALQAKTLLDQSHNIQTDEHMGLDHGAWSILKHMYPKANIPVFQLSIDVSKPAKYHYDLIKQLAALRKKGLMIVGSGNIVHNLGRVNWSNPTAGPYDWTVEFDTYVKNNLESGNHLALVDYLKAGQSANLSVPTNDHYLPMLYVLGIQQKNEQLKFIHHSFDMGSISMRSFMLQG
ncbi:MAG: 4,5-DOPA dioxygenase extradiol [Bacteroidia bacterium]